MKKITVLLIAVLTAKIVSGQICSGQQIVLTEDGQCDYNDYILEFEDNFDGNSLDLSKWVLPYQGVLRDFNHTLEKQWYANTGNTPIIPIYNNIEISNGTLKLNAKKESSPIIGTYISNFSTNPWTYSTESFDYSSAQIASKYKFGYGKYEILCKIPKGKGLWPAFWLYGNGDEIDVFEFWNENTACIYDASKLSKVPNMTIHRNNQQCGTDYTGPDFSQNFHTFTVIWDNYKIEWYIDGSLRRKSTKFYTLLGQSLDCDGVEALGHYIIDKIFPREPMNIIANLAIQTGNEKCGPLGLITIDNNPDSDTPFPSSLEIEYIRYYKQVTCGEVTATDVNQLNLSNDVYNLVTGITITVGGNVSVQSGQQLELVARDEIVLSAGLSAEFGSNFVARIDPTICAGERGMANPPSGSTSKDSTFSLTGLNSSKANITEGNNNFKIKTYPNPNNGILLVEFEQNVLQNYELYLINAEGKVIYSLKSIKEYKIEINLTGFGKGNYVITVLDTKNKNAFVNKIIYN